ncbi:MAG: diadenylate cyclase CdaA [bacterium]
MTEFVAIKDILDILLVFLIFYGIYLSIRGTRALQLILGIAVLLVFMGLAFWFQLRTLDFLFRHMFEFGLIFLIVVFQPEIRSGLANLGQHRFWSFFGELQSEKLIRSLLATAESLSKREIGALVAIEQEVGLKNYIKTGTEINSEVTSELIMTIFMSKGPLHDGGIIIKDNSIKAAGCIFPLSDRTDLPSSFGTRHRAAVGLAEESDALVVVISEETGNVTLVHRNKIVSDVDLDTLEDHLYLHLTE